MVFSKQLERKSNLGENQLWLGDCFDYVVELLGLQGFGSWGPWDGEKILLCLGLGTFWRMQKWAGLRTTREGHWWWEVDPGGFGRVAVDEKTYPARIIGWLSGLGMRPS